MNLKLDMYVMINWQLPKKYKSDTGWPVLHDCIATSGVQLIFKVVGWLAKAFQVIAGSENFLLERQFLK